MANKTHDSVIGKSYKKMAQEGEKHDLEKQGAHVNLALDLDESVTGYNTFTEIPIKTTVIDAKDVVDFPTTKSQYSETDDVDSGRQNVTIFFEDLPQENDQQGVCKIMDKIQLAWTFVEGFVSKKKEQAKIGLCITIGLLYVIYFCGAVYHYHQSDEYQGMENKTCDQGTTSSECFWCHGLGFLIIITAIVVTYMVYSLLLRRLYNWFFTSTVYGEKVIQEYLRPTSLAWDDFMKFRYSALIINGVVISAFLIFLIVDSSDDRRRLLSILGLVFIIIFGAVFSKHPGRIRWRHVMWGLALQFIFGLIILRWSVGRNVFDCFGKKVNTFINTDLM